MSKIDPQLKKKLLKESQLLSRD